jgi:hypothetical protein
MYNDGSGFEGGILGTLEADMLRHSSYNNGPVSEMIVACLVIPGYCRALHNICVDTVLPSKTRSEGN